MNAGSAGVSPAPSSLDAHWRSRGYLPHFDQPGLTQMVTYRLADALPIAVLSRLEPGGSLDSRARRQLEAYLDAGYGACHLRRSDIAVIVERALVHFDGVRYRLLAWVVMPNHVHVLIETCEGISLSTVVYGWKSYTAKAANRLLDRQGRFWQPEYFDRAIRDECHYLDAVEYIHQNPRRAGLAMRPEDWPFSSAHQWPSMIAPTAERR